MTTVEEARRVRRVMWGNLAIVVAGFLISITAWAITPSGFRLFIWIVFFTAAVLDALTLRRHWRRWG